MASSHLESLRDGPETCGHYVFIRSARYTEGIPRDTRRPT